MIFYFLSGFCPIDLEDESAFDHLKIPRIRLQDNVFEPINQWFKENLTIQESCLVERDFLFRLAVKFKNNPLYSDFHKWYQDRNQDEVWAEFISDPN